VPVTAKFSEEFYDRLGHRVAGELVDWFNNVDDTYRSEFRELFRIHFAQLSAHLESRLAEQEARWERRFGELRAEVGQQKADLIKWMFAFWAPTAVGVIALLFR